VYIPNVHFTTIVAVGPLPILLRQFSALGATPNWIWVAHSSMEGRKKLKRETRKAEEWVGQSNFLAENSGWVILIILSLFPLSFPSLFLPLSLPALFPCP